VMKTAHFGSNRSYGLSKAILLYSDGQETFATVHEPKNSPDGGPPYLDASEPLSLEFLRQLAKGLGQTVAREILPANVLARTPDLMVWWTKPQRRAMFFSDSSDGRTLNGKIFPQPPLVFRACGSELAVRALAEKHLARRVHDLYFEPQYEEFRPRTLWSLSNAFTSAFKELDPIPQFKATAKLGAFLEERLARKF
jgi:PRTRC genetic system protein B